MGSQQMVQLKKGLSSKLSPWSLDFFTEIYRKRPRSLLDLIPIKGKWAENQDEDEWSPTQLAKSE